MVLKSKKSEEPFYDKVEKIQGWLNPAAGRRTQDILEWQAAQGIKGNLFEIGVFCGKYFALLLESAIKHDGKVLGVDTFQFTSTERVDQEMDKLFGADAKDRYTLMKRASSTLTSEPVRKAIGRPRFISIDGAHDYENVFRDLEFCEDLVAPNGIISVDDFLNPLTLGVNQAVNAFYQKPRKVVPVAYVSNKLFLAHASHEDRYRKAFEQAIMKGDDPQSKHFRAMIEKGRDHVAQPFYGHEVLLS